jgi:phosphoribosylformylglycinamidine synthase
LFTARYGNDTVVRFPVAHHDGQYYADEDTLDRLEDGGRVAFRYCDADGATTEAANPNGSARNIAGIFNREKTVLGLMPHPERAADALHGGTDGRALFAGLAEALA